MGLRELSRPRYVLKGRGEEGSSLGLVASLNGRREVHNEA